MRMRSQLEETELALLALEPPARFELEHPRNQAVPRMKHEHVERPLGTRAMGGGVLGERKLEKGVQLHALAAAAGIVKDHAAGRNISSAGECRDPPACARGFPEGLQDPPIPVTPGPASIRNPP